MASFGARRLVLKKRQKKLTEIEEYAKEEELAIEQYYKVFAEERAEILREENFSKIDFLPEKYLNSAQLVRLISYLEDYRADNIKEAINILCSEEQLEIKFKQLNTRIENLEKSLDTLKVEISDNIDSSLDNIESSLSNLEDEMSQLRFDLKD